MTVMQATLMVGVGGPHIIRVVKQNDETDSTPPIFTITDDELILNLRADTLYEIKAGIRTNWPGTGSGNFWRLSPSTSVAHAALAQFGLITDQGDGWAVPSADPTGASVWNTARFNADTFNTNCSGAGNQVRLVFGMIKTDTSPCTVTVVWGNSSTNPNTGTLRAGSWLYAREVEEE